MAAGSIAQRARQREPCHRGVLSITYAAFFFAIASQIPLSQPLSSSEMATAFFMAGVILAVPMSVGCSFSQWRSMEYLNTTTPGFCGHKGHIMGMLVHGWPLEGFNADP